MRKALLLFVCLCFASLARAQTGTIVLSVTSSPIAITVNQNCNYVVIEENSGTPTNAYTITLPGQATGIVYAAGTKFVFSSGDSGFKSGQTLGTISIATGTVQFIGIESLADPTLPSNGKNAGGASPGGSSGNIQVNNGAGGFSGSSGINTPNGSQLNVKNAGVFTNAATTTNFTSVADPSTSCTTSLQTIIGGAKVTIGNLGCVSTPTSGTTNGFSSGLVGAAQCNDPNAGGAFGNVECVGDFNTVRCAVSNTTCENADAVFSIPGNTGNVLLGREISVFPQNTTDSGFGLLLDMSGSNVQPTGDNLPAVDVQTPSGSATFTSGLRCEPGGTSTKNCIEIEQNGSGASHASQNIVFTSEDSALVTHTGTEQFEPDAMLSVVGAPFAILNPGAGLNNGYAVPCTPTSALAQNTLVKLDTGNARSCVICTTADTTACNGFVQGTNTTSGICVAADMFCPVVMTSGSIVQGILGTGTCSIGQHIIVDTTTNGDIKCQAGIPSQGAWIGDAMSAQSTVGLTVDIRTRFQ